ncbi:MAG: FKBP-type peptidyl-prolyl cis-trans isomerase [Muribaculaceae bacterium]|nr:FKBP-type peptidyl-prolyl cis-trans isomerase [Muribaculaceae bacterium]
MDQSTITPGQYVELVYELFTISPKGESLVHTVDSEQPESFIFGITPGLVEGLAEKLQGMKAGQEFDIAVPADKGFIYSENEVVTLPLDIFTDDEGQIDTERVKVGARLPMITADGYQISGLVKAISNDGVTMDFNHPLVGKDLRFRGKVLTVRQPTPEELQPYMGGCGGCGGGCCGGSDNGCADGGCCGGCGQ